MKRRYRQSLSAGSEEDATLDPDFHELRTPAEQAADGRKKFRRNRSYSRIPLATVSPHPIPQQFIERTTPLPRTAVTPNGSDDDGRASISLPSLRKRSYSAGSAMMLDDADHSPSGTAGSTSASGPATTITNPKIRGSGLTSPASASASAPRAKLASRSGSMRGKQRTRSNPQLAHRPGTSASYAANPASAPGSANKHPEGQPPWALTGYKPDPTLPPDQQIIPTLARRLQQDQWERDGAYASVYDKELRPLKVMGDDADKADAAKAHPAHESAAAAAAADEWPLKSSAEPARPLHKPNPSTDGGYRTIPSVSSAAAAATARWVPPAKLLSRRSIRKPLQTLLARLPKSSRCRWPTTTVPRRSSAAALSCRCLLADLVESSRFSPFIFSPPPQANCAFSPSYI